MPDNTRPCRFCRTEIDTSATVCPQCGKRQGVSRALGCIAILVFGALLVFALAEMSIN